jgi:uncharacterized protein
MPITISKVFNANIYIDGKTECIGRAKEVKLPEVAAKMVEHSGLGMAGVIELPAGLEKMSMSIKWLGIYGDLIALGCNPFTSHALQIRANHETFTSAGRSAEVPLVILATASWKKCSLGTLKGQDGAETDDELAVTYLKLSIDGKEIFEIDVLNNIWKVDGVDILAQFKASQSG